MSFESESANHIIKNDYLGSELLREYYFSPKIISSDDKKNNRNNNIEFKSSNDRVLYILHRKFRIRFLKIDYTKAKQIRKFFKTQNFK